MCCAMAPRVYFWRPVSFRNSVKRERQQFKNCLPYKDQIDEKYQFLLKAPDD